jgi:hypothetical protein
LNVQDSKNVVRAVKQFEVKAKENTGESRKQFRKAEPKKTLADRVKDAIREEEEKELMENF